MSGSHSPITRRQALGGGALFIAGAGLSRALPDAFAGSSHESSGASPEAAVVPFAAAYQAGVATPAQDYLLFAAFDVTATSRSELQTLLEEWTAAAAAITRGEPYRSPTPPAAGEPPADTGEAQGLSAARLTLTFGFGPTLFKDASGDRFGLSAKRPSELQGLPGFRGESLQAARSGGDLCVQACADDPQVAFHAIHVLARIADGTAVLRWSQAGFGRTSSTSRAQQTPRNLMGFKDGTDNIRAEDEQAMRDFVWVQSFDGPRWMVGGTYLIVRRIRILFDVWDATSLEGQEQVIGREKQTGAPLGEQHEYDPVDLSTSRSGQPAIPSNAHIRVANPANNDGQRILRRGYSYNEGVDPGTGQLDAGLFFIAFQRSPRRQFIPLQRRLAETDALNRHTLHTASAIFACPPGALSGEAIGQPLFS